MNPDQTNNTKESEKAKIERSLFLTTSFAGLGTGFITFWLTLTLLYSGLLCLFGAPLVWLFVKEIKGEDLVSTSITIYLISALIGISVGFASSFGSGMPVTFG